MPALAPITVHESQWPDSLAAHLRRSLETRRINHKFHYDSPRQVRQWLKLHESYSPARREQDFHESYLPAFQQVVERVGSDPVHLIGLGSGGGQKEAALLNGLQAGGRSITYTASDVSSGMVVTSLRAAWEQIEPSQCSGVVCDLAEVKDVDLLFSSRTPAGSRRVITFFGMIPNFEPDVVCRVLDRIVRPGDLLLCSANLARGADYRAGVEHVLPQYDNQLTREWLSMLLADLGLGQGAGRMHFSIEDAPPGLRFLRITADFEFDRASVATIEGETFEFKAGERLRLFFSYRHTPETLNRLLGAGSIRLVDYWKSRSGEEGVFLADAAA